MHTYNVTIKTGPQMQEKSMVTINRGFKTSMTLNDKSAKLWLYKVTHHISEYIL